MSSEIIGWVRTFGTAGIVLTMFTRPLSAALTYQAIDLFPVANSSGPPLSEHVAAAGQVVSNSPQGVPFLQSTAAGFTVLTPTNLPGSSASVVWGTNGIQQVGQANFSFATHALLWNGTANSAVDLNPTKLPGITSSTALDTNGTQQVGSGSGSGIKHALLWNGSASSAVDLHPTTFSGFSISQADGTDGVHQVGWMATGFLSPFTRHALLWSGTAGSAADLNPINLSGYVFSEALGVGGNQQVGDASTRSDGSNEHAMVWNGSANTAVDLNPTNLGGSSSSEAYATNGSLQVGYATTAGHEHAVLWSGTAASAIDLQSLLPSTYVMSMAYSVDSGGNVFGYAEGSDAWHAIEWSTTVPEPAVLPFACVIASLFARRHARSR